MDRSYRSLLRDMDLALLSEIGARAIYDRLGRRVQEETLGDLLIQLNRQGAESVARLQDLMRDMGGRPRSSSLRRRLLARLLAGITPLVGLRPILRVCMNAEQTVGRWYGEYARFLSQLGDGERARTCEELGRVKQLHAQALEAWVANMGRR